MALHIHRKLVSAPNIFLLVLPHELIGMLTFCFKGSHTGKDCSHILKK